MSASPGHRAADRAEKATVLGDPVSVLYDVAPSLVCVALLVR